MKDLSVIVPTKDEPTAPSIIAELYKTFGKDTEVIVIDKSSNEELKRPLLKSGARVVTQSSKGYENALQEGFRLAKGEIIATIDADGTYDVSDLKRVIDELATGDCGFVSGNRFGRLDPGAMTSSIKMGNILITSLFNLLYRCSMRDVLSGSFAMRRDAYDSMRDEDPYRAGTVFFEIELRRRGYKLKNIPVHYGVRAVGSESQISRAKPIYGITMAYHAIKYARDYQPMLIFGGFGLILGAIGLILGLSVIAAFLITGVFNEIGRALIAFMLLTFGFLSIAVGLILDLLLEIERTMYKEKR